MAHNLEAPLHGHGRVGIEEGQPKVRRADSGIRSGRGVGILDEALGQGDAEVGLVVEAPIPLGLGLETHQWRPLQAVVGDVVAGGVRVDLLLDLPGGGMVGGHALEPPPQEGHPSGEVRQGGVDADLGPGLGGVHVPGRGPPFVPGDHVGEARLQGEQKAGNGEVGVGAHAVGAGVVLPGEQGFARRVVDAGQVVGIREAKGSVLAESGLGPGSGDQIQRRTQPPVVSQPHLPQLHAARVHLLVVRRVVQGLVDPRLPVVHRVFHADPRPPPPVDPLLRVVEGLGPGIR